ncbi:hypothetical protein [Nocardioides yefusunii]|uniref:Uncharacterized protein n=1 Tax=Nocardioides yefusunii TaxID=2500546 RepID=A0ABW1QUY5_9ACTN|nr:hypothetical protein [Nocardioides yefusunii]
MSPHTPHTPHSRRALIRAATWTVPAVVVASTAPAYASSVPPVSGAEVTRPSAECRIEHTMVWHRTKPTSSTTYAISSRPSLAGIDPVTVTIRTEFVDSTPATDPAHYSFVDLKQSDATYGITDAIKFAMTKRGTQVATMRVTFVFSRPVQGLSFIVTDIDSNDDSANQWWSPNQRDRVFISHVNGSDAAGRFTPSQPKNSKVSGAGLSSNPWLNRTGNSANDVTTGNVKASFSGEVSNFSMTFENYAPSQDGTNSINIGGMHFETQETTTAC